MSRTIRVTCRATVVAALLAPAAAGHAQSVVLDTAAERDGRPDPLSGSDLRGVKSLLKGTFRGEPIMKYGNWYGPGWWGGGAGADGPGDLPPTDALDEAAMRHDLAYMLAERAGKIYGKNEEYRLKAIADALAVRDAASLDPDPSRWKPPPADPGQASRYRDRMITAFSYQSPALRVGGVAGEALGWVTSPLQSWELDRANQLDAAQLERQVSAFQREWFQRRAPASPSPAPSPVPPPSAPPPSPSPAPAPRTPSATPTAPPPVSRAPDPDAGRAPDPARPDRVRLKVAVRDRETDEPIAGAHVRAAVAGHEAVEGVTDESGKLVRTLPAGDTVQLAIRREGYTPRQGSRPITGESVTASVYLDLAHEARIRLVLRDRRTREPIAGAVVEAGSASGTTSPEGGVTLKVPPGEPVTITARADGYRARKATGTVEAGQTRSIGWYLAAEADAGAVQVFEGSMQSTHEESGFSGSMSGPVTLTLDPDAGTFALRFSMSGRCTKTGPITLREVNQKGALVRKFRPPDVVAHGRFQGRTIKGEGTYDPESSAVEGRLETRISVTLERCAWKGKEYRAEKGETSQSFVTRGRVTGQVKDGEGVLELHGSGRPDRLRVEGGRLVFEEAGR